MARSAPFETPPRGGSQDKRRVSKHAHDIRKCRETGRIISNGRGQWEGTQEGSWGTGGVSVGHRAGNPPRTAALGAMAARGIAPGRLRKTKVLLG